jgi:hypothetical protein
MTEMGEYRAVLAQIYYWAEWHTDDEAEIEAASPQDLTAHINGLIRQECARVMGWPKPQRRYLKRADTDVDQLIARLRAFQDWRRGGEGEQPDPAVIGADIDAAISMLARLTE